MFIQNTLRLLALSGVATACFEPASKAETASTITSNIKARSYAASTSPPPSKIAIDNVRVFNGDNLSANTTVIIDGSIIDSNNSDITQRIDAKGATLLPGLIDSHCHPRNATHLQDLTHHGVTTAFIMACFEPQLCKSRQGHPFLMDARLASAPASAPGSLHGNLAERVNSNLLIANASDTAAWMKRKLAGDPDFIKLVAETPGLSRASLTRLTKLAHDNNKKVVVHAASSLHSLKQYSLGLINFRMPRLTSMLENISSKARATSAKAQRQH